MDPGLLSWLPLVVKVGLTALIVVTASVLSERVGALVGAMIVTLPVTVWPAYLFLSLDHPPDFVVQAAVAGLAVNAVTAIFYLVYIGLAQRCWLVVSLGGAIPVWIALAVAAQSIPWTFGTAILLNLVCYPAAAALSYRYRAAVMPRLSRQWYDLFDRDRACCQRLGRPDGDGTDRRLSNFKHRDDAHSACTGRRACKRVGNGQWIARHGRHLARSGDIDRCHAARCCARFGAGTRHSGDLEHGDLADKPPLQARMNRRRRVRRRAAPCPRFSARPTGRGRGGTDRPAPTS